MQMKDLSYIFIYMRKLFQDTMKELFINACAYEETSLYFFVIEICDNSKRVSFVDEQLGYERIEIADKQNYDEIIEQFLKKKFVNRRYVMAETERFSAGCQEYKLLFTFYSGCLDKNEGALFAKCVFEQLAESFYECLVSVMYADGDCSIEEVVLQQSAQLCYTVQKILQKATAKVRLYLEKLYSPLNLQFIASLSGEYYEKAECQSNMAFLFHNGAERLEEAEFLYRFDSVEFQGEALEGIDFVPSKMRLIRKLLQMTQKDLCLVLGENKNQKTFKVLGICEESILLQKNKAIPVIMIRFKKHMQWDMLANQTYIFTYKNGQYKIEQPISKGYLRRRLNECFGKQKKDNYNKLIQSLINSTKQDHGTMLVVMNVKDAEDEAKRLGHMCYGFPETIPRQAVGINQLNGIDGSIIIDVFGKIHGIGMILDGLSEVKGNLARGARYNSAIKYGNYLRDKGKCALILIVSEDGTADVVSFSGKIIE